MSHADLIELTFPAHDTAFSVRRFAVVEAVSRLFEIDLWVASPRPDVNLEELLGAEARFATRGELQVAGTSSAGAWSALCNHAELVHAEPSGLSTYHLRLVPPLWLLTQRVDYRIFQRLTPREIVERILSEWHIESRWQVSAESCPKLDYRVQYGETDYAFVSRLLEELGMSFTLEPGAEAFVVVVHDALGTQGPSVEALPVVENPDIATGHAFVSKVQLAHEIRPEAFVLGDYDFRKPSYDLRAEDGAASSARPSLEHYHYRPGAFSRLSDAAGETPAADDKGAVRHEPDHGALLSRRALEALRADRRVVTFHTNVAALSPGTVFTIEDHPHSELSRDTSLLVTQLTLEGSFDGAWTVTGRAVFAGEPYRPPQSSPRPEATGVQSATVVGPAAEEIHTDEFGRVRVRFPWDRSGRKDDDCSCWIRVSQSWAGVGYGNIMLPRVGQEVLVGFLDGNPDQPVVVGRVFNAVQRVPHRLPEHRTRSTWKSASTPNAEGFNEIMFEDLAGAELVYVQAQRDLRKLVQNDETITVGNNRSKLVKNNEVETTGGDRTETTRGNRTELTQGDRITMVGASETRHVHGDVNERTGGTVTVRIKNDEHVEVGGSRREQVHGDHHVTIRGDRNVKVEKSNNVRAESYRIKTKAGYNLDIADELHLKSGSAIVIEAPDITLKAAGGFIRIDASGVVIKGTQVLINSGGSAGSASGSEPMPEVEPPRRIELEDPDYPEMDDVSQSGLGRA